MSVSRRRAGGAQIAAEVEFTPPPGMTSMQVQLAIEELYALIRGTVSSGPVQPERRVYGSNAGLQWAQWWDVPGATHALLLVHGGGWGGGEPSPWYPYADIFANTYGITTICMEYRKGDPEFGRWQAIHADIAIMQGIVRNLGLVTVMGGESAGGQLVGLLCHQNQTWADGIICISGPHHLSTQYGTNPQQAEAVDGYIGYTPADGAPFLAALEEFSPVNHVSTGGPPTWLAHSPVDTVAPYQGSVEMVNACTAAGVPVTLDTVEEAQYIAEDPLLVLNAHQLYPYIYTGMAEFVLSL